MKNKSNLKLLLLFLIKIFNLIRVIRVWAGTKAVKWDWL